LYNISTEENKVVRDLYGLFETLAEGFMCNAGELILGIVTSGANFLIFLLLLKRHITKKDKKHGHPKVCFGTECLLVLVLSHRRNLDLSRNGKLELFFLVTCYSNFFS